MQLIAGYGILAMQARPLHLGGPFTVHESGAALTVPVDPHLATEERAVERHEFDTHVTERMKHQEVISEGSGCTHVGATKHVNLTRSCRISQPRYCCHGLHWSMC